MKVKDQITNRSLGISVGIDLDFTLVSLICDITLRQFHLLDNIMQLKHTVTMLHRVHCYSRGRLILTLVRIVLTSLAENQSAAFRLNAIVYYKVLFA